LLKLTNLHKRFGDQVAVNGLSLEVQKGEIFGLLGPNGAGKTTTVHMAVGVLEPTEGSVLVGVSAQGAPTAKNIRRLIGVAPQELSLYENLSAEENLHFFGSIYNLKTSKLHSRIDEVLDIVGLSERREDLVKTYSGGMKRRLNIATALMHEPELLFLAEPTAGVDPQSRNAILEMTQDLRNQGTTIVYTTHYMEEAERICDRIAIVDHGRVLQTNTVDKLIDEHGGQSTLVVEFVDEVIRKQTDSPLAELNQLSTQRTLRRFHVERPTLEQVFLNLTGKSLRLFFTIIFPLLIAVFFGSVFGGGSDDSKALPVVIVDKDASAESKAFIGALEGVPQLDISQSTHREEAFDLVLRGKRTAFVVLPKGFGEPRRQMFWTTEGNIELGVDPARKAEAAMLQGILSGYLSGDFEQLFTRPSLGRDRIAGAMKNLKEGSEQKVFLQNLSSLLETIPKDENAVFWQPMAVQTSEVVKEGNSPPNGFAISFPQGIVWGLMMCAMTFGMGLISERTEGTLMRLRVAPISRMQILAGKAGACFVLLLFIQAALLGLGALFGLELAPLMLILGTLLATAVCFVGIMMLLSVLGRTEKAAQGYATGIMMAIMMLGGGMIPLFVMPSWMQTLSHASPAKWAVLALEGCTWREFGLGDLVLPWAILLAAGVACFALGVRLFRDS
jgi:ABC-2 type transport system ATP-binding protein